VELRSPAFVDGALIPARYGRDGDDCPPPLEWSSVPVGTAELAIEVLDPDAPSGTFVHWIAAGIDPTATGIDGGTAPGMIEGRNGWGEVGYGGPRPPKGDPAHRYVFTLYALAEPSGFEAGGGHVEFVDALRHKELTQATLTGRFAR
jgi:Raf kinase inhibitor-like YbhB/YbcL family protein